MKRYLFASILFLYSTVSIANTHDDCYSYAQHWVAQYLCLPQGHCQIPIEDLFLIRDLVQSSLKRSELTLIVQQEMWPLIELIWQGWQNVIQTRLNPAKQRPYLIPIDKKERTARFWDLLDAYDKECNDYAYISQQVVYKDALKSELAKKAVEKMRQDARVYMVRALTDVKKQLEAFYNIVFKASPDEMADSFEQEEMKRFSLGAFLLDYVPNLAMHKFIEADALYINGSEDGWMVLKKMQLIGNQVWQAIEAARVEFYSALLHELVLHL